MATHPKLLDAWKRYYKLRAEGLWRFDEGNRLYTESEKLISESSNPCSAKVVQLKDRSDYIRVESNRLYIEAKLTWINAVIEVYGEDMIVEWRYRAGTADYECILGNGDKYTVEMGRE